MNIKQPTYSDMDGHFYDICPSPAAIRKNFRRNTVNKNLAILGLGSIAYSQNTLRSTQRKPPLSKRYKSILQRMEPWLILREAQLAYRQRMKEYYMKKWTSEDAKAFGAAYGWLKNRFSRG